MRVMNRQKAVMPNRVVCSFAVLLCLSLGSAVAEKRAPQGVKATVVRETKLYVQPNATADRVATVTPGREMVIVEHSGKWLRVFANTDVEITHEEDTPVFGTEVETPPVSGWLEDKGVIAADTPKGDQVLYGEAATVEELASEPHAPHRAAQDARLMYRRVVEMFPQSPRAPEAMWRAADIRWQLQKADVFSRPSAHEKENYLREQLNEDEMKKIQKQFPRTKWADLAAYDMIDNKLCGDWQGSEKCPEKEADIYMKYVEEHADSPKTPEALYKAAWRLAAAGDMWTADDQGKKADEDRGHAKDIAGRLQTKYPDSDYAARAAGLVYKLEQGIPIYGSDLE
jgi:outer membrane protein assembly factor BamD (BamD/ComL family)